MADKLFHDLVTLFVVVNPIGVVRCLSPWPVTRAQRRGRFALGAFEHSVALLCCLIDMLTIKQYHASVGGHQDSGVIAMSMADHRCYRSRWVPPTVSSMVGKPSLICTPDKAGGTGDMLVWKDRPGALPGLGALEIRGNSDPHIFNSAITGLADISLRETAKTGPKQPKQPGAPNGDLLAKGQSGNATGATRRCAGSDRVIANLAHCAPQ